MYDKLLNVHGFLLRVKKVALRIRVCVFLPEKHTSSVTGKSESKDISIIVWDNKPFNYILLFVI